MSMRHYSLIFGLFISSICRTRLPNIIILLHLGSWLFFINCHLGEMEITSIQPLFFELCFYGATVWNKWYVNFVLLPVQLQQNQVYIVLLCFTTCTIIIKTFLQKHHDFMLSHSESQNFFIFSHRSCARVFFLGGWGFMDQYQLCVLFLLNKAFVKREQRSLCFCNFLQK